VFQSDVTRILLFQKLISSLLQNFSSKLKTRDQYLTLGQSQRQGAKDIKFLSSFAGKICWRVIEKWQKLLAKYFVFCENFCGDISIRQNAIVTKKLDYLESNWEKIALIN
jgi:hypothetical protein